MVKLKVSGIFVAVCLVLVSLVLGLPAAPVSSAQNQKFGIDDGTSVILGQRVAKGTTNELLDGLKRKYGEKKSREATGSLANAVNVNEADADDLDKSNSFGFYGGCCGGWGGWGGWGGGWGGWGGGWGGWGGGWGGWGW